MSSPNARSVLGVLLAGAVGLATPALAAASIANYSLAPGQKSGPGTTHQLTVILQQYSGEEWLGLDLWPEARRSVHVCLIGTGFGRLLRTGPREAEPTISAYFLTTSTPRGRLETLEFVDSRTGGPRLPTFFGRDILLPKCLDNAGNFLKEIDFLGRHYMLYTGSHAIDVGVTISSKPARLTLDDDVLIGTSRNFRNKRPGRRYTSGRDYEYVPFTEADYQRMIDAGINYFDRVTPQQFEWVRKLPAFFVVDTFEKGGARIPFPEILYHPGFLGVEDFVDEPSYLMTRAYARLTPGSVTLESMAKALELRVLTLYTRGGLGRPKSLSTRLKAGGIEPPPGIETVVERLPIWEEHFSTACYQLRQAGSSFIHEGRYDFPYVPAILNETYRTRIPMRPSSTFLIYYALLRGAARVTNKDWGMSIYGQADPAHAPLALQMAYDRGARQLWFWTSDRSHHLPFAEQLKLARGIRDYIRANPRRPRAELVRGAEVAIVLPHGFTFPIDDYKKRRLPDMWRSGAFPLDGGRLPSGVSYYAVLQAAARRMEEMIRAGREFDVVIDVPEVKDAGYAELIYVLADATESGSEFPRWILHKEKAVVALLALYIAAALVVRLIARRREGLKAWMKTPRVRTFASPWRLVLPWALALALKHHLLTALRLEHMLIGPQRDDWLIVLYVVAVFVVGFAAVGHYWWKHLRGCARRTVTDFAGMVILAFVAEYELFLWLGRGNIIA